MRAGFLLPSAALVGFVILSLAGLYFFVMRQQDVRGRRFQGTLVGRYMAQGAVRYVAHLIRDAASPRERLPGSPEPLAHFRSLARHPASDFPKVLKAYAPREPGLVSRGDHRGLIEDLFGSGASAPLDALEDEVPGASLYVTMKIEPEEFPERPEWLTDEAQKALRVVITAEASFGNRKEVAETCEHVVVYPLEAPLVSRFTANAGVAWHEDGRPFPEYPFDEDLPDRALFAADAAPEEGGAAAAFADKGWAFPRALNVRPGGGAWGQHHLLWRPEDGEVPLPAPRDLDDQPAAVQDPAPYPGIPDLYQEAWLMGLVQGGASGFRMVTEPGGRGPFSGGVHDLRTSGIPPEEHAELVAAASGGVVGAFGPFGTTLHPSPTYAPGSRAILRAVSAVVVDRDAAGRDEREQEDAVGVSLPKREAVAYLNADAPREDFDFEDARQVRERGGWPAGFPRVPDEVENRNRHPEGVEGEVSTEVPWDPVRLDAGFYDPFRLYPDAPTYRRFASRTVHLPLHAVFALANLPVEESQAALHRVAWGSGDALDAMAAYREVPRVLAHRDPVHEKAAAGTEDGVAVGTAAHYTLPEGADPGDADAAERRFLEDLAEAAVRQETRWQPTAFVWGEAGLRKFFPDGDLRGHRVHVFPEKKGGVAEVTLQDASWHSGTLVADILVVTASFPARGEGQLLELASPNLFLVAGAETHLAARGNLFTVATRPDRAVKVRGRVYQGVAPPLSPVSDPGKVAARVRQLHEDYPHGAALLVVYDGARDPLGPGKQENYRVAWGGL